MRRALCVLGWGADANGTNSSGARSGCCQSGSAKPYAHSFG